jgi:hypothetical protein
VEANLFLKNDQLVTGAKARLHKKRNRKPQSLETREKIRRALLGRKHNDDRRKNISEALTGRSLSDEHRASRGQMGRLVSEATRAKISGANKGRKPRPRTRKQRLALSIALSNRTFTEEHRANLSERWHDRAVLTCPHCDFACYQPQFGRWHGDRCRRRRQVD